MNQLFHDLEASNFNGAVIGVLTACSPEYLVDFPENPMTGSSPAMCTIDLKHSDVGSEVVILFANNDPMKPIITGLLKPPLREPVVDHLDLTAEREVTLRCGKASITLTKEGKIILRGTYISSRSSGPNRIKGGSVHLN